MRAHPTPVSVLLLALAVFASALPAHAQGFRDRREEGRGERRAEAPRREYRGNGGYRGPGPVYGGPAPGPRAYAYPPSAAPPAYYPPAAPPPYAYPQAPPPSAYRPNSLGAGWGQQQDEARRGVRQGRLLELGRVVSMIRQTNRGRMLDAGLEPGPGGRPTYRVRWAAEGGRRIDFIVDAATGAIIGRSGY